MLVLTETAEGRRHGEVFDFGLFGYAETARPAGTRREGKPRFGGREIGPGFRLDFLIEEELVLELKSVEKLLPVHEKQVLTYLKVTGLRKGLLMNFNASLLKQGIRSIVR